VSPVPTQVGAELERVVRRWQQLPLDRALERSGAVRRLVQQLADRADLADLAGRGGSGRRSGDRMPSALVPDLGPATLMDQLTVMVHDVCAADAMPATELAKALAGIRQELR
jgi:hypothetical protein